MYIAPETKWALKMAFWTIVAVSVIVTLGLFW